MISQERSEDLLAEVAHELKNPLTCIQGYASQLADPTLSPEFRDSCTRRILACCAQFDTVLKDLTTRAALHEGRLMMDLIPTAMGPAIREAAETFEIVCAAKNLQYKIEIPAETGSAMADRARLTQVLHNLLANSVKHVARGGKVSVSLFETEKEITVEVADDGAGIDPADQEKVFDRSFQSDEGRRRGGLGLGLHMAKIIVEGHGGRLGVRSRGRGRGATFYFILPKTDLTAAAGTRRESAVWAGVRKVFAALPPFCWVM